MAKPLAEPRKQVQHRRQRPAGRAIHAGPVKGCQILGNAEIGEDLSSFGDQTDAGAGKFERVSTRFDSSAPRWRLVLRLCSHKRLCFHIAVF